jgi:hypothetical protein
VTLILTASTAGGWLGNASIGTRWLPSPSPAVHCTSDLGGEERLPVRPAAGQVHLNGGRCRPTTTVLDRHERSRAVGLWCLLWRGQRRAGAVHVAAGQAGRG